MMTSRNAGRISEPGTDERAGLGKSGRSDEEHRKGVEGFVHFYKICDDAGAGQNRFTKANRVDLSFFV